MKKEAIRLVKGVKSVTEFLNDAIDAFKDNTFVDAIEKALPWAKVVGDAAAEALPPLKFISTLAVELLKETDPEKLGMTACTISYQRAVASAFKQIGGPSGERQSIKEAKDQLHELEHLQDIDMGTFSLETPQQHEFYTQATICLQVTAIKVGYTQSQVDAITDLVQNGFRHSLTMLLSNGATKDKFEPFTEYLKLGGANEKRARKMLAQHANYQRWLFEQAPVLRVSPFALKHVYIATDCGQLKWQQINEPQRSDEDKINPFNEQHGGRKPLLGSVLDLIRSEAFSEAIIIQGVAGAGKSSFTLKLCDELLKLKLHPIRIRIKDLSFDKHIKDALPRSVLFGEEDYPEPEPFAFDNLFLDDTIFKERGIGAYAHICKYILILDGWDEISLSDEGFKKKVAQMLDQINDHYLRQKNPRIRVILTGRPSSDIGETNCLREETQILTIRQLRPEQLREYVRAIADAVNAEEPLIEKNEQTEGWTVPPIERFEPIFKKYQQASEARQPQVSEELDVLGLPLLTYLTVRLVAEWEGDLSPLLEDTTSLYRHLIDLTCKEAGKGEVGDEDGGNQHKIYGEELRQLLWQTAAAITMGGGESISRKELALRLGTEEEELDTQASRLAKEIKLSSLLISFYFKGGHSQLGCEFAHKSFREYLFAESLIETLKDFGRKQKQTPSPRDTYWEDFLDNRANDFRFDLSRRLSESLAPPWLTTEVRNHIQSLIAWEVGRTVKKSIKVRPGRSTEPLTWEEWTQVRMGLADLWEWWAEGAHLRPQAYKEKGIKRLKPAYVNDLIEWDAPRDSPTMSWGYARTTTMDAHLGDGLFHLSALVHADMADCGVDDPSTVVRKYQSVTELDGNRKVLFKPSGGHSNYFQNYVARINSAGWRGSSFPISSYMHLIDLRGAYLTDIDFSGADFRRASLSHANFHSGYFLEANLTGADLTEVTLSGADLTAAVLINANLTEARLSEANLRHADLSGANLAGASLSDAYLVDANLVDANLTDANLSGANLSAANFARAGLSGANLSGADLSDADLSDANLAGAKLNRAHLIKTNLNRTKLSDEFFLQHLENMDEFQNAVFDSIYVNDVSVDRTTALNRLIEIRDTNRRKREDTNAEESP